MNIENAYNFTLAGNSTFTVKSKTTGKTYTFKVKKHKEDDIWFVSYLYGPNNTTDYKYMGIIKNDSYYNTKGSKVDVNSIVNKTFIWVFNVLVNLRTDLFEKIDFHHEGKCGRCGRKLTNIESLENGIGPKCISL